MRQSFPKQVLKSHRFDGIITLSIKNDVVLRMALIVSGRTISNKKKQAVPAFEWRTTQWIFRIQIFGAAAFRSPPKSLARSHAAQHWKLTALPRFPAADKIKKLKRSAGSIQHPVPGRGGNAGWYRKHHSEPDDELLAHAFPAVAEKVQENVKNAVQNMTNVTVSRVNLVIAGLAETTAAEKQNKNSELKPILSVLWPERLRAARNIMENILPRREARENAFLLAFSQTFGDIPLAEAITSHEENDEEHPVDGFSKHLLNAYYDHSAEVDDEIRAHLRNWTMERLPRVSLTILRLAVAEMLFGGENKPGVAINEAVELTKKYGADEDYQFVNGLLGAVARDHGLDAEQAEQ